MKTWSLGINTYYRTASYHLEEGPAWSFVLDWAVDWACTLFPPIPFPPIPITREGEHTTARAWYGDLRSVFHVYICSSLSDYCWKHRQSIVLPTEYNEAAQRHPVLFARLEKEQE